MKLINKLEHKLRPYLTKILSNKQSIFLYSSFRNKFFRGIENILPKPIYQPKKNINFCGLTFRNDIGNAAGFDKDGYLLKFNYNLGAGFGLVGTTLPYAHNGKLAKIYGKNLNTWVPLPHSMGALNSLGLPSKGIDIAIKNTNDFRKHTNDQTFPIGVSLAPHPLDKREEKNINFFHMIEKAKEHFEFLEINESCPNVTHENNDLQQRLKKLSEIKQKYNIPIFLKFQYIDEDTFNIVDQYKFDAITLCNTQNKYTSYNNKIHQKDKKLFQNYIQNYQGGLSGQIIKDFTNQQITHAIELKNKLNSPVELIHCGGIKTLEDIENSRQNTTIRQWYSGLIHNLYEIDLNHIYQQ